MFVSSIAPSGQNDCYGTAGVAINSAPTAGVKVVPLSQIKSTFPVLKNPANRAFGWPMRNAGIRV